MITRNEEPRNEETRKEVLNNRERMIWNKILFDRSTKHMSFEKAKRMVWLLL